MPVVCTPRQSPDEPSRSGTGRRRLTPLLALLLAAGLASPAARAQSLLDLYQAARGFDATYLAARSLAESAPYRAAQAAALRRPSVGLGGSLTSSIVEPARDAVIDSQGRAVGSVSNSNTFNSTSANLTLSGRQALFNRSNDKTIAQADKALEASRFELETAEQDLILRVAQAYFDVLAAQDTLATVRANKAATSEQLASAKRNFEVGTATITDTREAQAKFDLVVAQEIAADNDLRSKRVVLDQLVGRNEVMPRQLVVPVQLPPLAPADINEWVTRADAEHPAIRRAQIAFDVAQLETEKARAGNSPTLDAVASLSNAHATGTGATLSGNRGTTNNASIGVQFNLPLYTGGSVQNRIKETLALEERSRNDLDAARRAVSQATRTAFLGVQSGQAQVKALEAAESSNLLAVEATLLGYRVGVRVNLDVLNAQTQLFSTRRDLAQARYNVLLGSLRLRQASGRLTPADVVAIDQLLKR